MVRKVIAYCQPVRTVGILACVLGLFGVWLWLLLGGASLAQPVPEVAESWFAMRIEPDLVDWFNRVARANDIAMGSADAVDILDGIVVGRKMVMVTSLEEADVVAPSLEGRVDIIGYDLEHWPTTPAEEQAEPLATAQRLRVLAKKHGLALAVRIDRQYAADYGPQLTSYVDLLIIQAQRLQADPTVARDTLLPLIDQVRQSRSKPSIGLQLRSDGSVEQLIALTNSFGEALDGISILYTPSTKQTAQDFVETMQSGTGYISAPSTPQLDAEAGIGSDRAPVTPTPAAEPLPASELPPIQCTWPTGMVTSSGALMAIRAGRQRRAMGRQNQ